MCAPKSPELCHSKCSILWNWHLIQTLLKSQTVVLEITSPIKSPFWELIIIFIFINTYMFNEITWEMMCQETERRVGSGQCQHEIRGSYFVSRNMYHEGISKGIMSKSYQPNGNQNPVLVSWATANVFVKLFWPYQGKENPHSVADIFSLTKLEQF